MWNPVYRLKSFEKIIAPNYLKKKFETQTAKSFTVKSHFNQPYNIAPALLQYQGYNTAYNPSEFLLCCWFFFPTLKDDSSGNPITYFFIKIYQI